MTYLSLVFSLALLIVGADFLVKGAARIAERFRISPWLIGLTIVGFGSSVPELTVSVVASSSGQGAASIGNVIGSNVFNALFILGVATLISPLIVNTRNALLDLSVLIGSMLLLWLFARDSIVSMAEGLTFLLIMLIYLTLVIIKNRTLPSSRSVKEQPKRTRDPFAQISRYSAYIVAGLILLIVGSRLFVAEAVSIATALGISELFIGLTLLAVGTSLPELLISIVSSWRGQTEIAMANIVGSNIFNVLVVLGISSMISQDGLPLVNTVCQFDIPFLFFVSALFIPLYLTGKIERWQGVIALGMYFVYLSLQLILTNHGAVTALMRYVNIFHFIVFLSVSSLITYWFFIKYQKLFVMNRL